MNNPTLINAVLRFAVFVFFPVFCNGQSGLLPHGGSASFGMGGVFVCLPGLSGAFGNPANLAGLPNFEAELFYEERFKGAGLREMGIGLGGRLGQGAFGLSMRQFGAGAYREQLLQLSYARALASGLDIGIGFDGNALAIEQYGSRFMVNGSVGVRAELSPKIVTGFLVHRPFRPDAFSAGFMPSGLVFGLGYAPGEQFRIQSDFFRYALQPVGGRIGLEYLPHPRVQIRAGAGISPSTFSFGVGIGMNAQSRVHTSVSHHPFLGVSPSLGLQYLGKSREIHSASH